MTGEKQSKGGNMKTVVEVVEVENEGLAALLGKSVLLMCANYFYSGTLVGVNDTCVKIKDPQIVYETGQWSSVSWADAQKMHADSWYIQIGAIESFGEGK